MNFLKRINIMLLVVIIITFNIGTTAFASQTSEQTKTSTKTYDFEISSNGEVTEIYKISRTNVDDIFSVYLEHTGSSRYYTGNYLRYTITVTDANGNAVDNILAVRLCRGSRIEREDQFRADGTSHAVQNIPISSSSSYYFKYLLAYGTARTLRVHMTISSYS